MLFTFIGLASDQRDATLSLVVTRMATLRSRIFAAFILADEWWKMWAWRSADFLIPDTDTNATIQHTAVSESSFIAPMKRGEKISSVAESW